MSIPEFVGQALVLGLIGPLFWLLINVLENWLTRRGYPLAGLDLLSRESWRQYGIRRRRCRAEKKARALEALSK